MQTHIRFEYLAIREMGHKNLILLTFFNICEFNVKMSFR